MKYKIPFLFLLMFQLYSCTNNRTKETQTKVDVISRNIQAFYLYEDTSNLINFETKNPIKIKFSSKGELFTAKAKNRGGLSSKYDKHSYSIELENDTILFPNWKEDNDYIFNASYIDKTFLRHRFSYDLFKFFTSSNLAPNCHYKEIYLNEFYQGLFVIMEEVDKGFLGIKKSDSASFILKDGALFSTDLETFTPQKGEDIFQQKFPKKQTNYQYSKLVKLWNFIHLSTDEDFIENVAIYFDIDNVIDWHLLLLLTNNGDGVVKNFYWYKKNNEKWKVVPWDYDDSFGRNGDGTLQSYSSQWERNQLLHRLFTLDVNNYKKHLFNKWNEIRKRGLDSTFLISKINTYDLELEKTSLFDNFEKWPINDIHYSDSLTRNEEIKLLKTNYNNQLLIIDSLTTLWATQ